jgi:hypothetical protein
MRTKEAVIVAPIHIRSGPDGILEFIQAPPQGSLTQGSLTQGSFTQGSLTQGSLTQDLIPLLRYRVDPPGLITTGGPSGKARPARWRVRSG